MVESRHGRDPHRPPDGVEPSARWIAILRGESVLAFPQRAGRYANGGGSEAPAAPLEAPPPGQTALFNAWEDAVECAKKRRPHDPHRQLLHVPRLRHQYRL
jgi:hypothetical protein